MCLWSLCTTLSWCSMLRLSMKDFHISLCIVLLLGIEWLFLTSCTQNTRNPNQQNKMWSGIHPNGRLPLLKIILPMIHQQIHFIPPMRLNRRRMIQQEAPLQKMWLCRNLTQLLKWMCMTPWKTWMRNKLIITILLITNNQKLRWNGKNIPSHLLVNLICSTMFFTRISPHLKVQIRRNVLFHGPYLEEGSNGWYW